MRQLRLSGSGGQGVITAAIIMAEAAIYEGKEAVQSQSYGPEARGGASKAEVIISDEVIYHPKVTEPDVVLSMTQKAADKYYKDLRKDGILMIDEDLVPNVPDFPNVIKIPITRLSIEKLGKELFANMIALGALVKVSKIVSIDTIKDSVAKRVPPATIEQNMKAIQIGYDAIN